MDKSTIKEVLNIMITHYKDELSTPTRRNELSIIMDSIRQIAGEWVTEFWQDGIGYKFCSDIPSTYDFISDSQDVAYLRDYGIDPLKEYDSFFVKVDNGDYESIYGMIGTVPYLKRQLHRLK